MRLQDLVKLHLGGMLKVIDSTPAHFDLQAQEWLPQGVTVHRVDYTDIVDSVDAGALVLAVAGPVPERHGDISAILNQVRDLPIGVRVVVLLLWPTIELPYHRFLDQLVGSGCQVLQVASINSPRYIPSAMVVQRVGALSHLHDYFGDNDTRPGEGGADVTLRTMVRLADEYVLSDFVHRHLRIRIQQSEAAELAQMEAIKSAVEEAKRKQRAKLRATRTRAERAERKLAELRSSTSLRLGSALVETAQRPTRALGIPREFARIWKQRNARK